MNKNPIILLKDVSLYLQTNQCCYRCPPLLDGAFSTLRPSMEESSGSQTIGDSTSQVLHDGLRQLTRDELIEAHQELLLKYAKLKTKYILLHPSSKEASMIST